jgi:predicted nucleotidyltransferase
VILSHPLLRVFGGTRASILEHLLETSGSLSVRQAARLTGVAATTASLALQALDEVGLVDREDVGTSQLYRIVESHALVASLREVLAAARQVDDLVVRAIRREIDGVVAVWLYGSPARGDNRLDSDADLLVLVNGPTASAAAPVDVTELTDELRQRLGMSVSLIVLPLPGAKEAHQTFWRNVLRDAITLDGPGPHDLLVVPATRKSTRSSVRKPKVHS